MTKVAKISNEFANLKIGNNDFRLNNLIPYTLFESSAGYEGDITLSDDKNNYKYIEIESFHNIHNVNIHFPTYKIPCSDTYVFLGGVVVSTGNNTVWLLGKGYILYGNKLDVNIYNEYVGIGIFTTGNGITKDSNHNIYITKVVGYK